VARQELCFLERLEEYRFEIVELVGWDLIRFDSGVPEKLVVGKILAAVVLVDIRNFRCIQYRFSIAVNLCQRRSESGLKLAV